MHVPRRLYQALPWLYIALGLSALGFSDLTAASRALSLIAGLVGFAGLIGGTVLVLRRRQFREFGARYDAGRADRGADLGASPRDRDPD